MKVLVKGVTLLLCLITQAVVAQVQKKEFKESFNVSSDVTVAVNTMNADVVFDTWNQNKVEVIATIEIEGLSKEEAQEYFNNWDFEALGNSTKVTITAGGGNTPLIFKGEPDKFDFHFDFDFPEVVAMEMDSLLILPPPPPAIMELANVDFDYEAFEKDGDAYLKKWQKQWAKEYKKSNIEKEMKEWGEKMAKKQEVWAEKNKALMEKQELLIIKQQAEKAAQKTQEFFLNSGENEIIIIKDGKTVQLKIKKKIEIKLPKDAKLKINVRHGEVKLADNANINATLFYAGLHANTVQGNHTVIESSYAPVSIEQWNQGKLILNFSKDVSINAVNNIDLVSNSSDVTINKLTNKAFINANFGTLTMSNISQNFTFLDLRMDNMEGTIKMPNVAYKLKLALENTDVKSPVTWKFVKENKGYKEGYNKTNKVTSQLAVSGIFSNLIFL
ncbi:hypothetical protein [Neptunitalea lumnitzerae]|uniref:Adhesin domain-containing protein n=1 Tax=Neptunitalea lumnitzerae TaxID=2965509 RepID=A0ABQ5MN34_9FLAO|nr:hypothetical protein [Neptunitalea sp. Y10]GLB50820.1 hypothetical protein Y10_31880 [Neptunitalea sp. Y10]